ncbi:MAG: DUF420 domain-containing protein [Myxococcota bacterium]
MTTQAVDDRGFFMLNAVVSAGALAFLTWLLLGPGSDGARIDGVDLAFMPAVNACLNATAAVLIVAGWRAIRAGRRQQHQWLMTGAFAASSLFLVGYIVYHYVHGDTRYEGDFRGIYLTLLASHVILSIPVVPMALSAFYFAWKKRFSTHKKVTRFLAPIWLYVSVTGVLVFVFLHG